MVSPKAISLQMCTSDTNQLNFPRKEENSLLLDPNDNSRSDRHYSVVRFCDSDWIGASS